MASPNNRAYGLTQRERQHSSALPAVAKTTPEELLPNPLLKRPSPLVSTLS